MGAMSCDEWLQVEVRENRWRS